MPKITPISWKKLDKILKAEGFVHTRTEGSHMFFVKTTATGKIATTIPKHEIGVGLLCQILKQTNISRNQYFELLEKI